MSKLAHSLCKLQVLSGDGLDEWEDKVPQIRGTYSFCLGFKKALLTELAILSRIVPVVRPRLNAAEECGPYNEKGASE